MTMVGEADNTVMDSSSRPQSGHKLVKAVAFVGGAACLLMSQTEAGSVGMSSGGPVLFPTSKATLAPHRQRRPQKASIRPMWRLRESDQKTGFNAQFPTCEMVHPVAHLRWKSNQRDESNRKTQALLSIRGGAMDSDDDDEDDEEEEEEEYEEYEDDFGFDDEEDLDAMDAEKDDFGGDTTVSRALAGWKKTPPFTKAYLAVSFAMTMAGYTMYKNEFPPLLSLKWKPVLTKLQLWRPLTAFFNLGPFGLSYLLTAHFVWTYMSTLERLHYDRPYDFWLMILFGCVTMVGGYGVLKLSPRFLGHNLSTFLVYIWSRYHEGLEVRMFELFNTRAELLPWFFLGQTILLEGELPVLDLLGIVFGHIYHHFKSTNSFITPQFIVDWYNSDGSYSRMIRERYKEISSDFEFEAPPQ